MKALTRIYPALALSLMLVITGQSMAVARGMTSPTGTMVICTGTGPVVVPIDSDGQPTGPAYICPDCTLLALQAVLPDQTCLAAPSSSQPIVLAPYLAHVAHAARASAQARDPPAMA